MMLKKARNKNFKIHIIIRKINITLWRPKIFPYLQSGHDSRSTLTDSSTRAGGAPRRVAPPNYNNLMLSVCMYISFKSYVKMSTLTPPLGEISSYRPPFINHPHLPASKYLKLIKEKIIQLSTYLFAFSIQITLSSPPILSP